MCGHPPRYDPRVLERVQRDEDFAAAAARASGGRPTYCDNRYYRAVANGGQGKSIGNHSFWVGVLVAHWEYESSGDLPKLCVFVCVAGVRMQLDETIYQCEWLIALAVDTFQSFNSTTKLDFSDSSRDHPLKDLCFVL